MARLVPRMLTVVVCAACVFAGDSPKPREESMRSDRFAEAHAPLFQPPKSQNAGALTDKVAASLPKVSSATLDLPPRNYIDRHIFGKMQRDKVPHAPVASAYEFLRRASLDLTGRAST